MASKILVRYFTKRTEADLKEIEYAMNIPVKQDNEVEAVVETIEEDEPYTHTLVSFLEIYLNEIKYAKENRRYVSSLPIPTDDLESPTFLRRLHGIRIEK